MSETVLMEAIDPALLSILSGLACHVVLNRFELQNPLCLIILFIAVPIGLGSLLWRGSSNIANIIFASATYLGTLSFSVILYRLSPIHPLWAYPGPVASKITKLYSAIISQSGKQHLFYRQLHEQYGDVVRVGPNELAFFTADAIEPMFGSAGLPKGSFWDGRAGFQQQNRPMVAIYEKKDHSARRRKWQRAFTPAALKVYEPLIMKRVTEFVDTLERQPQPVNLCRRIAYFADRTNAIDDRSWDFMFDLAYGGGSTVMQHGDVSGMLRLQDVIQRSHMPWLGGLCYFAANIIPSRVSKFRGWAIGVAANRVREGSAYRDIFYHVADEGNKSKEKPAFAEVVADGVLAVTAGSDTTSTVLSVVFYLLLSNPTSYQRLQEEIDNRGDRLLEFKAQADMPYLNAVINEAMRLVPTVPTGSHRQVRKSSQAKMIAGSFVPLGTQTFIPQYTLFHDKRYFSPLPDSFVPERWLPEEDRIRLEPAIFTNSADPYILNRAAFIPFSHGPENCVGKQLACMEMRMFVCAVLQRFDLRFAAGWDPKEWEDGLRGYFNVVKGKMPVIVHERQGRASSQD
ncbi:cytochrome P450 [Schizophyllum fasciatum]